MSKKILICPSIMCADFSNLENEIKSLDEAGTDIFHIDIMDGAYVPNFGMGIQDLEVIRKSTDKEIDVHLMVNNPLNFIDLFAEKGVNIIYFHPDSDINPTRTIDKIKSLNIKVGIVLNPGISIQTVYELLPLVDYVMIMTVNPGFAGQNYLKFVDDKILELTKIKHKYNFSVMVDGAISEERISYLSKNGVEGFVLGTSALFNKESSYKYIIENIREANK